MCIRDRSISSYGIWIAEVMLQQTQLKVVIPYWEKWMKVFPTLISLAEADLERAVIYDPYEGVDGSDFTDD